MGAQQAERPRLPAPVAAANAGFFGALSRLRGRRIAHPHGLAFDATLEIGAGAPAAALLRAGASHRALVRLSRATGVPEPLPDILGLAVRVPDAYGPGRHQDLLTVTAGSGAGLQHVLLPASSFFSRAFSSLLPFSIGGRALMLGFLPPPLGPGRGRAMAELAVAAEHGLAFELALAPLRGGWQPVGRLVIDRRRPDEDAERIRFNPWNSGADMQPATWVNRLRDAAYSGSQAATRR